MYMLTWQVLVSWSPYCLVALNSWLRFAWHRLAWAYFYERWSWATVHFYTLGRFEVLWWGSRKHLLLCGIHHHCRPGQTVEWCVCWGVRVTQRAEEVHERHMNNLGKCQRYTVWISWLLNQLHIAGQCGQQVSTVDWTERGHKYLNLLHQQTNFSLFFSSLFLPSTPTQWWPIQSPH